MIRAFWIRAAAIGELAWVALAAPMVSQQTPSSSTTSTPTVTFTLDFPQSTPEHYSIAVDMNGHARYECTGKVATDAAEQTYRAEWEVSDGNCARRLNCAKQAQDLAGKIESGNNMLALTGAK